tara:strand:- start:107 stop:403 length:297 start_codon:yes stop_codon:yes gene_type:complete
MTKFIALAAMAFLLSSGVAQAASYAPQPGGKGMQRAMNATQAQAMSVSDCEASQISQAGMAHSAFTYGGRDGRSAAAVNNACRNSVSMSGDRTPYSKR